MTVEYCMAAASRARTSSSSRPKRRRRVSTRRSAPRSANRPASAGRSSCHSRGRAPSVTRQHRPSSAISAAETRVLALEAAGHTVFYRHAHGPSPRARRHRRRDRAVSSRRAAGRIRSLASGARTWSADPIVQQTIANRLGWLSSPQLMAASLDRLKTFAAGVKRDGFTDVVLLGMGGSSLAPEVLRAVIGVAPGWPRFHMLDSTDPAAVLAASTDPRPPSTFWRANPERPSSPTRSRRISAAG